MLPKVLRKMFNDAWLTAKRETDHTMISAESITLEQLKSHLAAPTFPLNNLNYSAILNYLFAQIEDESKKEKVEVIKDTLIELCEQSVGIEPDGFWLVEVDYNQISNAFTLLSELAGDDLDTIDPKIKTFMERNKPLKDLGLKTKDDIAKFLFDHKAELV